MKFRLMTDDVVVCPTRTLFLGRTMPPLRRTLLSMALEGPIDENIASPTEIPGWLDESNKSRDSAAGA